MNRRLVSFLIAAWCVHGQSLASRYEANDWFALRDSVAADSRASAFYRGMVEAAFHEWGRAEKDLDRVLRSGGDAMQRFEAGMTLERLYMMSGRLRDARALMARLDVQMRGSPVRPHFVRMRALLDVVNGFADQRVVVRGASRVRFAASDGLMSIPVAVNGMAASYLVDTGSEISSVSESEARRLGLKVRPASIPLATWEGGETATGIASAENVTIGNFHLRNVLFAVTKDGDDGVSGILGMPVLLALETLRWHSDGTMELGFPGATSDSARANVAFAGVRFPIAAAVMGSRAVMLGLDTGSFDTQMFGRFKREFGTPLGEVAVGIGGARTVLKQVAVTDEAPVDDVEWLHGWLGMDLLAQGRSATLDFRAMRLSIDGLAGTTTTAATEQTANTPASGADAVDIVRRSLRYQSLDLSPARDYVFLETKQQDTLDARGAVTASTSETREVMNLYDQRYERVVKKDGKPLSDAKARAEQAKFAKAVEKRSHETAAEKAKREDAERKGAAESVACEDEMMRVFHYGLAGEEPVNGRAAWVVDAEPQRDASPKCGALKLLTKFRFRVWVDKEESRWAKWEGDNLAAVTVAKFLLRVPPGTMHWKVEQSRHEDGVWLDSRDEVTLHAKLLLLASVRMHVVYTYSDYRRFRTDSRIMPVGDQ